MQALVTHLVEHPIPIPPAAESDKGVMPIMFLTPQERKKLRRRRRQEKEKQKQDSIRMGLLPPPPPKVKLANLMRVLGDQAVAVRGPYGVQVCVRCNRLMCCM